MLDYDVLVVGGGPAGSACARQLISGGMRVAVLDRERFPRTKLCAGWITPEVVADLSLDVAAYPHRFNTFEDIVAHVKGLTFKLAGPQHSIRRYEFDDYLLRRSGADVHNHNVKNVVRRNGSYVVDGEFRAPRLVGAGGTRCPVYRTFFRALNPRAKSLQAVTYEHEFPYPWKDPRCHLWFFHQGLPGYAWYVPKADGYLNCGIGGMAEKLKSRGEDIKMHWERFADVLARRGLIQNVELQPKGYSYYLRGEVGTTQADNAFIVGDAAGLSTRDLCEGIGPAVKSGLLAAESILSGTPYSLRDVGAYSTDPGLVRKLLEYMFVKRRSRRKP